MSFTYNPKKKKRAKTHGFLKRKQTKKGKQVIGRRRFGFVVSKKISTKAALRNKVKRRLRDAVAKNVPQIKKGGDVVIIALPGIEKKGFFEIEKEVGVLFKKLGIN